MTLSLIRTTHSTVSIIIPTYNRALFLPATIESLLAQTRVPDEMIVVNDGSTDNTLEILAKYSSYIIILNQSNQGRSIARNVGLQVAKGDLIAFLDSDDTLPPESILRRVQILEASPDIDVVYADAYLINDKNQRIGLFSAYRPDARPSGRIFAELATHNLFPIHTAMVRATCLGAARFDRELEPCEDFGLWLALSAKSKFAYIDEPLAYYRLHPEMSMLMHDRTAEAEVATQKRVFQMPEFQQLSAKQKARIYCSYGVKNGMLNRLQIARECFKTAIRIAPTYPTGYVLGIASLLGLRYFHAVILLRRKLVGNKTFAEVLAQDPLETLAVGK